VQYEFGWYQAKVQTGELEMKLWSEVGSCVLAIMVSPLILSPGALSRAWASCQPRPSQMLDGWDVYAPEEVCCVCVHASTSFVAVSVISSRKLGVTVELAFQPRGLLDPPKDRSCLRISNGWGVLPKQTLAHS
jgi:hypothetical protein